MTERIERHGVAATLNGLNRQADPLVVGNPRILQGQTRWLLERRGVRNLRKASIGLSRLQNLAGEMGGAPSVRDTNYSCRVHVAEQRLIRN